MNKIIVTCNSSETAIFKKTSNNFFSRVLVNMGLDKKERTALLKIFKKVKSLQILDDNEADEILKLIKTKDFQENFEKVKQEFLEIKEDRKEVVNYSYLLVAFTQLITIGKIQKSLIDNESVNYGGKNYKKLTLDGKSGFFEVISENEYFTILLNLKSENRYIIMDNSNNSTVARFNKLPNISSDISFPDGFFTVNLFIKNAKKFLIFPGGKVEFSKKTDFYIGNYAVCVMSTNNELFSIEKKDFSVQTRDMSQITSFESLGKFLVLKSYFNGKINNLNSLEELVYLHDLETNKILIKNINPDYIYLKGNKLLFLSWDFKYTYFISGETGDISVQETAKILGKKIFKFEEFHFNILKDYYGF